MRSLNISLISPNLRLRTLADAWRDVHSAVFLDAPAGVCIAPNLTYL